MAWEWSHTAEAYDNAHENVRKLDPETLAVIYAEWRVTTSGPRGRFCTERYPLALLGARNRIARLGADYVADVIFEWMSEQALCENGGHFAWACPHGCGCHMVSFDREDETNEKESV